MGKKLMLAVIVIAVTLLVAEGLIRLLRPLPPFSSFRYEGAVFARSVLARQALVARDGDVTYPVNSHGYRGKEFEFEKPAGVVRVIVYGGSSVFDLAAPDHGDWPALVETILHSNGLAQVEVINAGIPGHATFDAFGRFYAEGHLLRPDYVVLYSAWNDIKCFREKDPLLRVVRPHEKDPRARTYGWIDGLLSRHSQIYYRLKVAYFDWKFRIGKEGAMPRDEGNAQIQDAALRQYKLNVELFTDCARDIGAVPVLVTEGRLVSRDNTEDERKRIPYRYVQFDHDTLCKAFDDADRIMKDVAHSKNVPLVDAAKELSGCRECFYDHVHTTAEGSQRLAQLVAKQLERLIRER